MESTQILLLAAGVFMTLVVLILAFSGPASGKAKSRRLDAIRVRHVPGAATTIETQMRKITATKANNTERVVQRFVPNPALLRSRLERTGKDWSLNQFMGVVGGIAAAVAIGGAVMGAPLLLSILGGLALGLALPHFAVGFMINRRISKFTSNFPDAIELMVRGLRSGLPISETLSVVGSELPGPIGDEFKSVGDKIKIGRTMEAALQETADRLGTPEVQFFCITLAIQRETGGNLAETLSNLADVLRKRSAMKLKVKAMSSESKASAYIIGALPFLVFGIIYSISPQYMGQFFTDQRLIMIGLGGMGWMGIGAFVMAKMINFEI